MWKYGSALQQRPELNPYSTRGFIASVEGEGARGPGPREWGPRGSLTVHGGPGAPGLTPVGAVGPTRQPHPRARAADGRATRGSHSARPRVAMSARLAGGGAPAPRWSPPATTGAAERQPREGREGGNEAAVHGSPRGDGGDRGGGRSGGRRWRGSGRRGQQRSGGQRPKRTGGRGRRGCGEAEGGRRRGGRRSGAMTAADRSSEAMAERESDVASSNPARRKGGERRKRTGEARGGFK
uniref:Splicing coactivator subunit-like protein n=1 Tax=Oryza sativa subsp. japonica TaxID=39947 RepID=Q69IT6_ORYSJ|nr:splicing coactivator subunit-like protein [Oryza sativa Japonica Group]